MVSTHTATSAQRTVERGENAVRSTTAAAPVPAAIASPASVSTRPLDTLALEGCLADTGGQWGDVRELIEWLQARRAGNTHVVGIHTGLAASAAARMFGSSHRDREVVVIEGTTTHRFRTVSVGTTRPCDFELCFVDHDDDDDDDHAVTSELTAVTERLVVSPELDELALRARLIEFVRAPLYRRQHEQRTARLAVGICTSLQIHLQFLARASALRRDTLGRLLARPAPSALERSGTDALRLEVSDALQTLERSLREHCRRTLAADTGVQSRLATEVSRVGDQDFARETVRQSVSLSLRREFIADVQHSMRDLVENDLRLRLQDANATLSDLQTVIDRSLLNEFGRTGAAVAAPHWHAADFMGRVQDAMQFNVRYRGALPLRGFLHRLAEGRKSIFTVLMFTSLFGSFLGFNWRTHPALGWLFMVGFVIAVGWTFRSWRDDERERMDEELEKAREQLRMEARRLLGEVYREIQAAWGESVESARRMFIATIDEASRTASATRLRDVQTQRDAAQIALRQIEASDAALSSCRQRLIRIEADLTGWLVGRA